MTTDQQLDLDAIEAVANAATPGPWGTYHDGSEMDYIDIAADLKETGTGFSCRRQIAVTVDEPIDNDPTHRGWTEEQDRAQVQADAAYIAAMSPDVATALVAEVRRLRAAMEQIRHLHKDSPMGPCPVCIDADAIAAGGDGLMPYPCPTGRLAGAQDFDPPSYPAAAGSAAANEDGR